MRKSTMSQVCTLIGKFMSFLKEFTIFGKLNDCDVEISVTNTTQYGVHGYDNEDPSMHAMFIANGPIFAKGKIFQSINIINLYSLFCFIVDIKCSKTDGFTTPDTWNKMFTKEFRNKISNRQDNQYENF